MPLAAHNRRLHAAQAVHQATIVRAVDTTGVVVDRALGALWQQLLALIRERHGFEADTRRALAVLSRVPHVIAGTLTDRLHALYQFAQAGAVAIVARNAPLEVLRRVLVRQVSGMGDSVGEIQRLARLLPRKRERDAGVHVSGRSDAAPAQLTEAATPGIVALFRRGFRASALLDLLRQPSDLPEYQQRDLFASLLFPPPDPTTITAMLARWIRPQDFGAIGDADRRMAPDLARQLATDLSLGKSQREVAANLRPFLDGSRVRARRAARTFGTHTGHVAQQDAWRELGSEVIGYQLHSARGPNTRPWHAARHGTVYYANPGPGQKGYHQLPHPPLEPEDPAERPAGTPQTAWNCL